MVETNALHIKYTSLLVEIDAEIHVEIHAEFHVEMHVEIDAEILQSLYSHGGRNHIINIFCDWGSSSHDQV